MNQNPGHLLEESLTRERREKDACRLWASKGSRGFHTRVLCPVQLLIIKAVFKWGNQGQKGVVTCPESHSEAVAVSGFNIVSFCLLSIPLLLGVRKDLHRGLSEL